MLHVKFLVALGLLNVIHYVLFKVVVAVLEDELEVADFRVVNLQQGHDIRVV